MILINLSKNGERSIDRIPEGVHAIPSEDGLWLYIYDEDGLTVGVYPKDAIMSVSIIKAGEKTMNSENPK